jgi:hypothetical protein
MPKLYFIELLIKSNYKVLNKVFGKRVSDLRTKCLDSLIAKYDIRNSYKAVGIMLLLFLMLALNGDRRWDRDTPLGKYQVNRDRRTPEPARKHWREGSYIPCLSLYGIGHRDISYFMART